MGHEQDCFAVLLPDPQQLVLEQQAVLLIQIGERLIHQQNCWISRQGPGDAHPLAHAFRELMGVGVSERQQAHPFEMPPRARDPFRQRHAHQAQPVGHIAQRSHPRQRAGPLEHQRGAEPAGVAPGHGHRTCCRVDQPGQDVEQRRLPAAGRADQRRELAVADRKGDVLYCCERAVQTRIHLAQANDVDPGQSRTNLIRRT